MIIKAYTLSAFQALRFFPFDRRCFGCDCVRMTVYILKFAFKSLFKRKYALFSLIFNNQYRLARFILM